MGPATQAKEEGQDWLWLDEATGFASNAAFVLAAADRRSRGGELSFCSCFERGEPAERPTVATNY